MSPVHLPCPVTGQVPASTRNWCHDCICLPEAYPPPQCPLASRALLHRWHPHFTAARGSPCCKGCSQERADAVQLAHAQHAPHPGLPARGAGRAGADRLCGCPGLPSDAAVLLLVRSLWLSAPSSKPWETDCLWKRDANAALCSFVYILPPVLDGAGAHGLCRRAGLPPAAADLLLMHGTLVRCLEGGGLQTAAKRVPCFYPYASVPHTLGGLQQDAT